jgi:hypothetical protein
MPFISRLFVLLQKVMRFVLAKLLSVPINRNGQKIEDKID